MTTYRFKFSDVFPVDDPVARWLVTLSMGFNDVLQANLQVEAAGEERERLSSFRVASLHLWEIAKFIGDTYENIDEVRAFVDDLNEDAQQRLKAIQGLTDTKAFEVGNRLVQIRDLLAHYPEMKAEVTKLRDPVSKGMSTMKDEDAEISFGPTRQVRDLRLSYADDVVASATLNLIPTADEQRKVLGGLAEQIGEVTAFVQLALDKWLEPRMDNITVVEQRNG
jgi:hypothetical protein